MDGFLDRIKTIIKDIVRIIVDNDYQTINLFGPSGTGKSNIINNVVSSLKNEANEIAVIQLFGDAGKRAIPYYPLNHYLEHGNRWKNGLGPFIEGIPYLGVGLRHILDTTDCRHLLENKHYIKDNNVFNRNLSFSKELFLLYKKHEHIAIICDDIHYFDQETIDYLRGVISEFNEKRKKISLLASYNTTEQNEPYTFTIHDFFRFDLHYPTMEETASLLCQWGLNIKLNKETIEAIYSATGGHLVLLNQVCRFYAENGIGLKPSIRNNDLFLGELIDRRVQETESGKLIIDLLESLAAIGRSATIRELKCALNNVESINQTIKDAVSLNLLSKEMTTVSFINDTIRNITLSRSHLSNEAFFLRYSKCLKMLLPSEYERRALAEELSGNHKESQVLSALHVIEQIREGITPDLHIIDEPQILHCINVLAKAYGLSFDGKNDLALQYLIDNERTITYPLLCIESKYAIFTFRFKSNLVESRLIALSSLIGVLDNCDKNEVEIWSRLMRLRIVLESSLSKLEEARSTYREHQKRLHSHEVYDHKLAKPYYECQLLSDTLYEPDVAHPMLLDLCRTIEKIFHRGDHQYLSLYYKVLINLSSNSIVCGLYEEACRYAGKAMRLEEECDFIQFPNTDLAINNYLLSNYYLKTLSVPYLANKYRIIVENHLYDEDQLLIELNYAGFLLLLKQYDKTLSVMNNLKNNNKNTLDPYYEYYYCFNYSLALYFSGDVYLARKTIEKIRELIDAAFPTRTIYYQKHYEIVKRLLHEDSTYDSLSSLQKAFSKVQGSFLSADWNYFKTVYLFSDLQIWTQF